MDINSPYLEPRPPPGGPPLLKSLLGRPMYLPGVGVCGRLVMEKSTLTCTDNNLGGAQSANRGGVSLHSEQWANRGVSVNTLNIGLLRGSVNLHSRLLGGALHSGLTTTAHAHKSDLPPVKLLAVHRPLGLLRLLDRLEVDESEAPAE